MRKLVTVVIATIVVAALSGASVHAAQVASVDSGGTVETYSGKHYYVSDPENYSTGDRLTVTEDDDGEAVSIENEDTGAYSEQQ